MHQILSLKTLGFFSPVTALCKIRSRHPRELKRTGLVLCSTEYANLKAQQ